MWYPDSGASNHTTGDLNSLSGWLPNTGSDQVVMGNGSGLKIYSTGNALLTPSVKLTNIRSQIVKNLLSISQLTKDIDCLVEFFSLGFCVTDRMSGKILLQGRTKDGLYVLGAHNTKPSIGSHLFTAAREQFLYGIGN